MHWYLQGDRIIELGFLGAKWISQPSTVSLLNLDFSHWECIQHLKVGCVATPSLLVSDVWGLDHVNATWTPRVSQKAVSCHYCHTGGSFCQLLGDFQNETTKEHTHTTQRTKSDPSRT